MRDILIGRWDRRTQETNTFPPRKMLLKENENRELNKSTHLAASMSSRWFVASVEFSFDCSSEFSFAVAFSSDALFVLMVALLLSSIRQRLRSSFWYLLLSYLCCCCFPISLCRYRRQPLLYLFIMGFSVKEDFAPSTQRQHQCIHYKAVSHNKCIEFTPTETARGNNEKYFADNRSVILALSEWTACFLWRNRCTTENGWNERNCEKIWKAAKMGWLSLSRNYQFSSTQNYHIILVRTAEIEIALRICISISFWMIFISEIRKISPEIHVAAVKL